MACYSNNAFSDSPTRFIFRNIIFWHLGRPREQFGIQEKIELSEDLTIAPL